MALHAQRICAPLAMALVAAVAGGCSRGEDAESDAAEIIWEPISAVLGNPPNFAQLGNGSTMSVVSRSEGHGSKAGALVELFYPKYSADNLWDSYVGIRSRGEKVAWAHQLRSQRVVEDTGIVQSDFVSRDRGLSMRIVDLAEPNQEEP